VRGTHALPMGGRSLCVLISREQSYPLPISNILTPLERQLIVSNLANLQSLEWDLLLMDCLFKNYLEMAAFMLTKIANVILELNAQSFN